jgi:protein-S-isoprenylcysteine O-methyltransferase Ste14
MNLKAESAKSGGWLFRWRSYLPLTLLVLILPVLRDYSYFMESHTYDIMWKMFCLLVSFFGLLIRALTIGHTPKRTSGRNTKRQVADLLNQTGLYSISRNPLYLGNFFMILGVVMFAHHLWLTLVYTLGFWLYYERIITAEEEFLAQKFGKEYEAYVVRTPAFIPKFKLWHKPELPFSFRTVLKREYSGFFGVIASLTALEFTGDYIIEGKIVFDPLWVSLFCFGLLAYLVLRTLKKTTRILYVEGR